MGDQGELVSRPGRGGQEQEVREGGTRGERRSKGGKGLRIADDWAVSTPILQMRKLRCGEVNSFSPGHAASAWCIETCTQASILQGPGAPPPPGLYYSGSASAWFLGRPCRYIGIPCFLLAREPGGHCF